MPSLHEIIFKTIDLATLSVLGRLKLKLLRLLIGCWSVVVIHHNIALLLRVLEGQLHINTHIYVLGRGWYIVIHLDVSHRAAAAGGGGGDSSLGVSPLILLVLVPVSTNLEICRRSGR